MDLRLTPKMVMAQAVLLALILTFAAAAAPVAADSICPAEADSCLIVNSTADAVVSNSVLTLREAVLLNNGQLLPAELTTQESAQVIINSEYAFTSAGYDEILFDPVVFAPAANATIHLQGSGLVIEPGPDPVPQCPPDLGKGPGGGGGIMGGALDPITGEEVPAQVLLIGYSLPAGNRCVSVERGNYWLRSIHFAHCSVAIGLSQAVASTVTLGSNNDGINDDAESLWFDPVTVLQDVISY